MKKIYKIIPLLMVGSLVSCNNYGDKIDEKEATRIYFDILNEQGKEDFVFPDTLTYSSKLSVSVIYDNNNKTTYELNDFGIIDMKNHACYFETREIENNTETYYMLEWYYIDNFVVYHAQNDNGVKLYQDFHYDNLKDALIRFEGTSVHNQLLNGEIPKESFEKLNLLDLEFSNDYIQRNYYSKGEGNFTLDQRMSYNSKNKEGIVTSEQYKYVITYDSYLFKSSTMEVTASVTGENTNVQGFTNFKERGEGHISLNVGGTFTKPDLKDFERVRS